MSEQVGLVMVQRNEGLLLALNVAYHLSIGVTRLVIVDNQSDDTATVALLSEMATHPQVQMIYDTSANCDQAALANRGLAALLEHEEIEWVFPCDADEFLWCEPSLDAFLSQCRQEGVLYGTLPWLNHLPDHPEARCEPLAYVRSGRFYTPSSEASWHQPGHFRKAFCARHDGMNIVIGGHYFRREANPTFFEGLTSCPTNLPATTGMIVHFELRDCGSALLRKLHDLSTRHIAVGVAPDGPWREREMMLGSLWRQYRNDKERLFADFAGRGRTLWDNPIPPSELQRRHDINVALSSLVDHGCRISGQLMATILHNAIN